MRLFRIYWALALVACAVLCGAAVWMGGLNQDEGWYLYAANLVAEGQMPYRDFAFTQGPLLPFVYSAFTWVWRAGGLLGARLFTLALGLVGILFAVGLARRLVSDDKRNEAALVVFFLLATNLYHLYYLAIPKTYALAGLFVIVGFYLLSLARVSAVAPLGAAHGSDPRRAAVGRTVGALLYLQVGFMLVAPRRELLVAAVVLWLAARMIRRFAPAIRGS